MAVLSLKNTRYPYKKDQKPIFHRLNADFVPGKVCCIIGKFGAGKTLLSSLPDDKLSGNLTRSAEHVMMKIPVNLTPTQNKCVMIKTHLQRDIHCPDKIWGHNKGGGLVYTEMGGNAG